MLGINLPDIILLGTLYPIIHFFLRDCDFQQQQRWCIVRGTSSKTSGFAGKLISGWRGGGREVCKQCAYIVHNAIDHDSGWSEQNMSSEWDVELRIRYHWIIPKDKNKK